MSNPLLEMQKQTAFEAWDGYFDDDAVEDSRAVYQETIQTLIDQGPEPPRERCLEILGGYIEAFNVLDEKYGFFIETTGREDICDTAVEMAQACGINDVGCDDLPGEGRDW